MDAREAEHMQVLTMQDQMERSGGSGKAWWTKEVNVRDIHNKDTGAGGIGMGASEQVGETRHKYGGAQRATGHMKLV